MFFSGWYESKLESSSTILHSRYSISEYICINKWKERMNHNAINAPYVHWHTFYIPSCQIILQVYVHILWPFLSTIKEVGEGYVLLLCFVWIVASVFTTITTTDNLYHTKFFTILFQIDENFFRFKQFLDIRQETLQSLKKKIAIDLLDCLFFITKQLLVTHSTGLMREPSKPLPSSL